MTTPRPHRYRGRNKSMTKHRTKETFDLEGTLTGLEKFLARRRQEQIPADGRKFAKVINKGNARVIPW